MMTSIISAQKRIFWLVTLVLVSSLFLAACGAQPTEKAAAGAQSAAQGATQKAPVAQPAQKATALPGYPAQAQAGAAPTLAAYAAPGQQPQSKAATAPTAYPAAKAGEVVKGLGFVEKAEATLNTSAAGKVTLKVSGNLPTPCHELKVEIGQPDKDGKLVVNFATTLQADKVCIQTLSPFEKTVELGPLAKGKYTIFANQTKAGEVTIP